MPNDVTEAVDDPHAMAAEDVASTVDVDPARGLSSDDVSSRREQYGRNTLGEDSGTPWWRLVWDQIANAVVVLLIGAAWPRRPSCDGARGQSRWEGSAMPIGAGSLNHNSSSTVALRPPTINSTNGWSASVPASSRCTVARTNRGTLR